GVRIGVTSCPARTSSRVSSQALWAAIPPVTPRSTLPIHTFCPVQGNPPSDAARTQCVIEKEGHAQEARSRNRHLHGWGAGRRRKRVQRQGEHADAQGSRRPRLLDLPEAGRQKGQDT